MDFGGLAAYAVDGNTNNFFHTKYETNGWVLIDMQETVQVVMVRVYNRQDQWPVGTNTIQTKLDYFQIRVGDSTFSNNPLYGIYRTFLASKDFPGVKSGRYVSVQNGLNNYFHLAEVEVYFLHDLNQSISGQV
jgi:hypothetical protein